MPDLEIRARRLQIPMRTRFKHASAERKVADSVFVLAERDGRIGVGEGCPRAYVTGEDSTGALAWIEAHRAAFEGLGDLTALRAHTAEAARDIDTHPAAWCAVELALLDLFGQEQGETVERLLGVPDGAARFQYSAVVSDESAERTEGLLTLYLAAGFRDFKFKVSGALEDDRAKLERLRLKSREGGHGEPTVRIDANNLWAGDGNAAAGFLAALGTELTGVEEPLAPRDVSGLAALSREAGVPIILDESLCRSEDVTAFEAGAAAGGRFVGNVRVSKMGGLQRSLAVVESLRARGWPIIVGAQVGETSVLTRAALVAARAAGDGLRGQEGAFGTILLEHDAVEPVLQFGQGGVLALDAAPGPGLGLRPTLAIESGAV